MPSSAASHFASSSATAITTVLDAGRAVGDLRPDVTAACLIGIFTVAPARA